MMKLLFICGANVVDGELKCASWIKSILTSIDSEFEIALASFGSSEPHHMYVTEGEKCFELFFCGNADAKSDFASIIRKTKPDTIVVFGTENAYTLQALEVCNEMGALDRVVVFAQGLCCVCARHYAEGVPERIIGRYTLRDMLRRQNIKKERDSLQSRAVIEKKALEITHHFIGRTTMDQAVLRKYNLSANYYKCNDILRNSFYNGQWKYDDCIKHRIFVSQYYYPIKGFHYLLEAISGLIGKYPDIKIAAAGYNPIQKPLPQKELKDSSYIRYIKSLIKKYGLQDHIELLGELSEERMKEEYLKAHVFVMPSTIENSPNSLAEAMMLGVPTIASDVGGVTDFAKHNEEAYIYPSSATYLLAQYIDKVFCNSENAVLLGRKGQERAKIEYDKEKNIAQLVQVFRSIAGE